MNLHSVDSKFLPHLPDQLWEGFLPTSLNMPFQDHPPISCFLPADLLVLPLLPFYLVFMLGVLVQDELHDLLLKVLLRAHSADLQLQQLHELIPAIEDSFGLDFVADFLPVHLLYFYLVELFLDVPSHDLIIVENK